TRRDDAVGHVVLGSRRMLVEKSIADVPLEAEVRSLSAAGRCGDVARLRIGIRHRTLELLGERLLQRARQAVHLVTVRVGQIENLGPAADGYGDVAGGGDVAVDRSTETVRVLRAG